VDPDRSRLRGDVFASGTVALSTLTEHLPTVAAAVFAQPVVSAAVIAIGEKVRARRARNVAELLESAASAAALPLEQFAQQAVRDEQHHEYTVAAFNSVQDMAMENKRHALGLSLAAAVAGDDAVVDDEFLFLDALQDLRAPHVRLLARISSPRPGAGQLAGQAVEGAWTPAILAEYEPGLAHVLPPLLAAVLRHGLVHNAATYDGLGSHTVTDRGRQFLHRLGPAPGEVAEPRGPR
jgi:hypothetical protein